MSRFPTADELRKKFGLDIVPPTPPTPTPTPVLPAPAPTPAPAPAPDPTFPTSDLPSLFAQDKF